MDIVVKGRNTEVAERFREHVAEKLAKIEKLDSKVISVDVECTTERNPRLSDQSERIELTIRSRGPVVRAEAAAQDCYAALDVAVTKLEARLRKARDRRKVHHGSKSPVSVAAATAAVNGSAAASGTAAAGAGEAQPPIEAAEPGVEAAAPSEGRAALAIREKVHDAVPMDIEQALYEMELVGHDFFLFVDAATRAPSVVYRRRGYEYGVIRLAV